MNSATYSGKKGAVSESRSGAPERVLVGISGGLRSAVAAALLKAQGFAVLGVHLELDPAVLESFPTRCRKDSVEGRGRAERLARALDIPLEVIPSEELFIAKVEDPVLHDRLNQQSSNPCLNCQTEFRVGSLLELARKRGIERVATGHGAKISRDLSVGFCSLSRAGELDSDQSHLLVGLGQERMKQLEFPLGDLAPIVVQRLASEISERLGEPLLLDPGRTQACLQDESRMDSILRARLPAYFHNPGPMRTAQGSMLGEHRGLWQHFPGKPLPLDKKKLSQHDQTDYVVAQVDSTQSAFVAVPRADWPSNHWLTGQVSWVHAVNELLPLQVTIRLPEGGAHWPARPVEIAARVLPLEGGRVMVDFGSEKLPLMAGETLVFLQGQEVLGSARVLTYMDFGGQLKGGKPVANPWEGAVK